MIYNKMPVSIDYSKGVIYKIYCLDTNIKDIYIGSTTNLVQRRGRHKSSCTNEKARDHNLRVYQFIRANGGWVNWRVDVLEQFPTNSKPLLLKREGELIIQFKANLNTNIAGRTLEEYKNDTKEIRIEKGREYYEENKEIVKEKAKIYRETNRDAVLEGKKVWYRNSRKNEEFVAKSRERGKLFRENNKEKIKEYVVKNSVKNIERCSEYYALNKAAILERLREKIICECGLETTRGCRTHHLKSARHLKHLGKK